MKSPTILARPEGRIPMLRCCLCCYLIVFSAMLARGAEPFHVFAPSPPTNEIIQWMVTSQDSNVSFQRQSSLELPFTPSSLAWQQDHQRLIVSSGAKGVPTSATIQATASGGMRLIAKSSLDHPTGYTSIDRSGKFFLAANYRNGIIAAYRIQDSGQVGELTSSVVTPNTEAHCILTTPDNQFAYVPCVKNNNALFQFRFDATTGGLIPLEPFNADPPAMFGPRHAAFHPSLPIVYFSNEQQLGVSVYQIQEDGQLTDIQHAITLPRRSPFVQGKRGLHASDLVLTRDGKRLFVAVRDFVSDQDSIFTFDVNVEGKLSLVARFHVGDIPWKLDLSPDQKLLFVSETGDRRLSAYRIARNGELTEAAQLDWNLAARDLVVAP
ncbi:lactonase family protein [Rhodopirellula bahusiensis]|uniref:lactonase family protein n=1 Tax=Rhodopirellula bahusiensis TaxID=2014065 RepID=UPI003267BAE1